VSESTVASFKRPIRVGIITVSDRAFQGIYKDETGPKVAAVFTDIYEVAVQRIVSDDHQAIAREIITCVDIERLDVVVTVGGTGCSIRDVTPEATMEVITRIVPGISETIRMATREKNPNIILSRGVSGMREQTLIFNLSGNPENAKMALESVLSALPHFVKTIHQQKPLKKILGHQSKKNESSPLTLSLTSKPRSPSEVKKNQL
jgi:molybdopterin adenylyltransferase